MFEVVDRKTRACVRPTDDWVEAESLATQARPYGSLSVRGTHPTHEWAGGRCLKCGGWDNGSYGSHAPCGYDWAGGSLLAALERECAAREAMSDA